MVHHHATRLVTLLLGIALLLVPAMSASASEQALVLIFHKSITQNSGAYPTRAAGYAIATVETGTPTPSVMWAGGQIAGNTSFTTSTPYLPSLSSMLSWSNLPGIFKKTHAGAAPSGGSTMPNPAGGVSTTKCFASIGPFAPGGSSYPGSCFPRPGTGIRAPGTKKYGGTARLLQNTKSIGVSFGYPSGLSAFSLDIHYAQTPALSGPDTIPGAYGVIASGFFTNVTLMLANQTQNQRTEAPFTTGAVTAKGGAFGTSLMSSGSFNLNPTNLTGMISVVKPILTQQFARTQAGTFLGGAFNFAVVGRVEMTFLPEPGTAVLLGSGVLVLAGVALRKRQRS